MQALLFDFDGVIVHTEPEYDRFFETLVRDMRLPVEHFAERLKGKRLVEALEMEFPQFSPEQKGRIIEATRRFELSMNLPLVSGVLDFIRKSKARGCKVGLVTSSIEPKMEVALGKLGLAQGVFDTVVMAGRIERGKPDPMCYLLAADDLGVPPGDCIVFEDSLAGVQAGLAAGMTVVGLTGKGGGRMAGMCDYLLDVPHAHTPLIQEMHEACMHLLCQLIDHYLFENAQALSEGPKGA